MVPFIYMLASGHPPPRHETDCGGEIQVKGKVVSRARYRLIGDCPCPMYLARCSYLGRDGIPGGCSGDVVAVVLVVVTTIVFVVLYELAPIVLRYLQ